MVRSGRRVFDVDVHVPCHARMVETEVACHILGTAFSRGSYGLPKDEAEAKRLYEKMPGCAVKMLEANAGLHRERAEKWLREHSG